MASCTRRTPSTLRASVRHIAAFGIACALVGCGGSNNTSATTTPVVLTPEIENYTVGGTISNLTAGSVVLANGTSTLTVPTGTTTWTFGTTYAPGSSYAVTVQTQPSTEICAVTSGATGTNTGSVSNVAVVCGYGEWNWLQGSSVANAEAVFGTQGVAAAANVPGARQGASSWTDSSGNLWLFGGQGFSASGSAGDLNDLWRYNPGSGQWTWVSGASTANASGVYGTLGTAAAANAPGARQAAVTWTDSSGNLWLFGGVGYDSTGISGSLNDLWQYNVAQGQWLWVGGANIVKASGIYGTQGTAAAANVPGARYAASAWKDSSGNFWLFGGYGYDSTGGQGKLNDLWQYVPSSNQWTWINGEDAANVAGVYGTLGIAATTNVPGARQAAASWVDSSNNLWLYGGVGYSTTGSVGSLNDLWEYSISAKEWTWISGSLGIGTLGVYGVQGTAVAGDAPGGRSAVAAWIDASNTLWLFGGNGTDAVGTAGYLNDLWQYTP
jgi:N-acetylneuraminic acid mutarotase